MIEFQKVRYKNFLSVGENPIEIVLNNAESTLISGNNGCGKSSVIEAIVFALYGKAQRSINKKQLINSINERKLHVTLWFRIGKDSYRIERGIKPTLFEIHKNDDLLNQEADARDYQKFLEQKIIGMSYTTFNQIVVLASANYTPFMELKPKQRREVVENMLNIGIFTTMWNLSKQKISEVRKAIDDTDHELTLLENTLDNKKLHLRDLKSVNTDKRKKLHDSINRFSLKIEKERELLSQYGEQLKQFEDVDGQLQKHEKQVRELESLKSSISHNSAATSKRIKFFETNDVCPTCSQQIEESFRHDNIKRLKTDKSEFAKGLNMLQQELKKFRTQISQITDEINERGRIIVNKEILYRQIESLERQKSSARKELEEVIDNEAINKVTNEIEEINKKFEPLKNLIKELKDHRLHYECLYDLFRDSGIKAQVIKQYLPLMNKYINAFLEAFNFFVSFTLDENFNEIIRAAHRDEYSFFSFSEGEKTKISLAILFAWREVAKLKNSIHTNLLFLDEIGDSSLDEESVENLFAILNKFDKTNIFIISHRIKFSSIFNQHIQFAMQGNFTKLIEDNG